MKIIRNLHIKRFIVIFLGYNDAYQLWYVPMYLSIVLIYPFIYKTITNDKFRLLIIFTITCVYKFLSIRFNFLSNHPFDFIYYFIFYEIGVICETYKLGELGRKYKMISVILYSLLVIIISINQMSKLQIIIQNYMIYPVGVITYYFISMKLKYSKILNYLGKYSFYIFLLHEPVINTSMCKIL